MNNIKLMVCPHDTASNPDKWYHFAQYLTQSLSNGVHFNQSLDFPDFHKQLSTGGLIYANPQDSLRLITEHQYKPLVRPSNLFDEIVFVANNSIENPQITDLNNHNVISVNSMLVTRVGIKHLFEQDLKPSMLKPAASWMAVAKAIFRNDEQYGFLYKDFYEGLNSLIKGNIKKIAETSNGTIHHNLLVSPTLANLSDELQALLTQMHIKDERTKKILTLLGIEQFNAVSEADILAFNDISALGNGLMVSPEIA